MTFKICTRRDFSTQLATFLPGLGIAVSAFTSGSAQGAQPEVSEEISHTCEAIHQEIAFNVAPQRVYEALVNEKQFDQVVRLSAAMQSGMALGSSPTQISTQVGGVFTLFGGHIVGRQIELVPSERIVQAWRVVTWEAGIFSIARFGLVAQDSATKLVFDHTGFPQGQAQHLADGWRGNYWEPLAKFLISTPHG